MNRYPYAQSVTWISRTPSGVDDYGNDTYTETETATTAVFAPGSSTELTDGRDTVIQQPSLYGVDVDLPVKATDAFLIDADRFQVDGDPQKYRSPFTGWAPGQVIPLRRVVG